MGNSGSGSGGGSGAGSGYGNMNVQGSSSGSGSGSGAGYNNGHGSGAGGGANDHNGYGSGGYNGASGGGQHGNNPMMNMGFKKKSLESVGMLSYVAGILVGECMSPETAEVIEKQVYSILQSHSIEFYCVMFRTINEF